MTLSALNSAGGTITVLTPSPVVGANGSGALNATFSKAQLGLQLQVSATVAVGVTPGTATTDMLIGGASLAGSPGTPGTLGSGISNASLPNGSFGSVFLVSAPCAPTDPVCSQGTVVTLAGTFSNGTTHLYSDAAPASISWTCPVAVCPHPDTDGTRSSYSGAIKTEGEQAEEFAQYPIQVSLRQPDGSYGPYGVAPACRSLTDRTQRGLTGQITNPAAVTAGYCVDVYAINRAGNTFGGDLTLPLLFVEDPKILR